MTIRSTTWQAGHTAPEIKRFDPVIAVSPDRAVQTMGALHALDVQPQRLASFQMGAGWVKQARFSVVGTPAALMGGSPSILNNSLQLAQPTYQDRQRPVLHHGPVPNARTVPGTRSSDRNRCAPLASLKEGW